MWLSIVVACAPHVDIGEIPVERAARPPKVVAAEGGGVVVRVGLGSGDDPVGREGLAVRLANSLVGPAVDVDVGVGATHFTCHRACEAELAPLVDRSLKPPPRQSDGWTHNFVELAWRMTVFGGHPLGRPPMRRSVVGTLTDAEADAMYRRFFVRENVVAAVGGPELDAVRSLLSRLPPALPPDRTRVRATPARGPRMVVVKKRSDAVVDWMLGEAVDEVPGPEEAAALLLYGYTLGNLPAHLPTAEEPWFSVENGGDGWRAAWRGALADPTDAQIEAAERRAERVESRRGPPRPWGITESLVRPPSDAVRPIPPDAVRAAVHRYLSPDRWTLSVGDANPESVRISFLEGAPSWFVQGGNERPTATRLDAEEMLR